MKNYVLHFIRHGRTEHQRQAFIWDGAPAPSFRLKG